MPCCCCCFFCVMDPPSWDPGTIYVFDPITDEAMESCLKVLRQETDRSARADAAEKLTVCVERQARGVSTESFEKFELQLHQRVVDMLAEPVSVVAVVAFFARPPAAGEGQTNDLW